MSHPRSDLEEVAAKWPDLAVAFDALVAGFRPTRAAKTGGVVEAASTLDDGGRGYGSFVPPGGAGPRVGMAGRRVSAVTPGCGTAALSSGQGDDVPPMEAFGVSHRHFAAAGEELGDWAERGGSSSSAGGAMGLLPPVAQEPRLDRVSLVSWIAPQARSPIAHAAGVSTAPGMGTGPGAAARPFAALEESDEGLEGPAAGTAACRDRQLSPGPASSAWLDPRASQDGGEG